jgi:hypothetical protein
MLRFPRKSTIAGFVKILTAFAISGILHSAAGLASGVPLRELGAFRFFCTQAVGVLVEQGIISMYRRLRGDGKAGLSLVGWRVLGFAWVAVFMAWSGPAWVYPQAARAKGEGEMSFLPFSVVALLRKRV